MRGIIFRLFLLLLAFQVSCVDDDYDVGAEDVYLSELNKSGGPKRDFKTVDCGWPNIRRSECQKKNCAWAPNNSGKPFCVEANKGLCSSNDYFQRDPACILFFSIEKKNKVNEDLKLTKVQKWDCGYSGITQQECEGKGCAWLPGFSGPWCQLPESPYIPSRWDILGFNHMGPDEQFMLGLVIVYILCFCFWASYTQKFYISPKPSGFAPDSLAFSIILLFSLITRFYRIEFPNEIVFDEFYFGKFTNQYCNREFVFDIHGPFAKLVFLFLGNLLGHECSFDFQQKQIQEYDNVAQYVPLRAVSACFGTLIVPIIYLLCRELNLSALVSYFAATMVLFDTLLLSESRLVLTDTQLFFWTVMCVYCAIVLWNTEEGSTRRNVWTVCTAVSCGLAFSIKFTSLATLAWVMLGSFFSFHPNKNPLTLARCCWALIIGFIVFCIPFYIHFQLAENNGNAAWNVDVYHQSFLKGNPYYKPDQVKPGFLSELKYTIIRMLEQNAASLGDHPYASYWHEWIMGRGHLLSYTKHDYQTDTHGHIYIFSQPFICFAILISMAIYILAFIFYFRTRNFRVAALAAKFKIFICLGFAFLLGFIMNLLPYAAVKRTTYSYHYLPSQFYGIVLCCLILDFLIDGLYILMDPRQNQAKPQKPQPGPKSSSTPTPSVVPEQVMLLRDRIFGCKFIVLLTLLVLLGWVFFIFCPWAYGFPIHLRNDSARRSPIFFHKS